jgi:hypothetical protein
VTGEVQRKDPAAGVNALQLCQRRLPQAAIEGQAVEENQRRPGIGFAPVVGGEPSEGSSDGLLLPAHPRSAHLHVVPFVF